MTDIAAGIGVDLLEVSTIKPIDTEALSAHGAATIEILGIQDRFGDSGDYLALLGKYGISAGDIEGRARAMVAGERR